MRVYIAAYALALMLSMSLANAMYLQIVGPASGTLQNNGSILLGNVGPGESFYVLASAATTNASGKYINIGWDTLEAVRLPQGWSAQPSPLYENPMKLKVTVSPNATIGPYAILIRAVNINNYSKLGNLTITAYINVTTNVFKVNVSPQELYAGVGQPVNLLVAINNTGISDDPFIISAQGLPAFDNPAEVIALHGKTSEFAYPVYMDEPGVYKFKLVVESASSPTLRSSYDVALTVSSSLANDYEAINQGVVLSPVILEPGYAVMQALYWLYGLIKHG
ncbi:MAG: hypothetical protein QW774_02160 [Candidatus Micrarchaeaceae archaeon]